MKLKKHFLTLLLSISTFICFSQESEIVISEDHLISLIQKIKDKRAANQLEYNTTQELLQKNNNTKAVTASKSTAVTEKSVKTLQEQDLNTKKLDALSSKMNSLESELKYLNSLLLANQDNVKKKDVVIYQIRDKDKVVPTSSRNVKNDNAALILSLQQQVDSLKLASSRNEVKNVALVTSPMIPTNNDVAQPNTIRVIRDTIVMNNEPSDYLKLEAKYKEYIEKVFFGNNSKEINADQVAGLDQVITAMQSSESIDVYLKGFASKKGTAVYNQNLSFLRTESVKRYLIAKGIHPSRILSQYHGVDYNANEEESRRVDATFIVRK